MYQLREVQEFQPQHVFQLLSVHLDVLETALTCIRGQSSEYHSSSHRCNPGSLQ